MEKISIGNSRLRYFVLLLASLGFVIGGLFLMSSKKECLTQAPLWGSIIFFAACSIVFIWQIIDSRPRLVIDDNGIFDRTLRIGIISWADIEDAYLASINRQSFICLKLKDENKYLSKMTAIGKAIKSANIALGFQPININLSSLAVEPEQICELIIKKAAESRIT